MKQIKNLIVSLYLLSLLLPRVAISDDVEDNPWPKFIPTKIINGRLNTAIDVGCIPVNYLFTGLGENKKGAVVSELKALDDDIFSKQECIQTIHIILFSIHGFSDDNDFFKLVRQGNQFYLILKKEIPDEMFENGIANLQVGLLVGFNIDDNDKKILYTYLTKVKLNK